jgi:hypothetical protein
MSIRPFISKQSTFGPDALDAMSKAFDEVCVRLQIAPDESDRRERLAEQIIDLARSGVAHADVLREILITSTPRSGL